MRPISTAFKESLYNNKTQLIHLSLTPRIKKLKAMVPSSAVYEDKTIARVCFSDSIDKALSALQGDIGIYYVYTPKDVSSLELFKPSREEVFDVDYTSEIWSLVDTPVKCIGTIKNKNIIKQLEYQIPRSPWVCYFRLCDWEYIRKSSAS